MSSHVLYFKLILYCFVGESEIKAFIWFISFTSINNRPLVYCNIKFCFNLSNFVKLGVQFPRHQLKVSDNLPYQLNS